uniref:NAC domain-containing protein n=1 Tax=Lotus japonicus TaxID=34305 RepID=I3SGS1_LOTJA|nr:unknown [Lotus japonicus]
MMHEFRPPNTADTINTKLPNAKNYVDHTAQEAEIWTLCRIFKRNVSQRKHTPELRLLGAKRQCVHDKSSRSMMSSAEFNTNQETYINFGASLGYYQDGQKPTISNYSSSDQRNNFHGGQLRSPTVVQQAQVNAASSNFWMNLAMSTDHFFTSDNWDELGSVVKFAA